VGVTAALAGSALCIALSSCADVKECRAEEREDYPDLESLARSVMAEVPVQNLSRGSYCATTGKTPRASVGVEVRIWDSLDDGFAYLRSWGFTPLEYEGMVSADGRYRADVRTVSHAGDAPGLPGLQYVVISFSLR
jgi:hypothetical protein